MGNGKYVDALCSLIGEENFICGPSSGPISECIIKEGTTLPSKAEIDAEIIRLQAEWTAQEYARNRASEYPALAEQLDEIYHNGIDSWKAVIKVTKDKYPKG